MKLAIGSDKSGFALKEAIKAYLQSENIAFDDLGTTDLDHVKPYYAVASTVAPLIQTGAYDRAEDYTAVFSGEYIYDEITEMNLSEYKWIKDSAILYGDADCDGEVTIIDATVIQRVLVNMNVERFNVKAADVDGKGLDIIDATLIQRFLVNMIDRFPAENRSV